MKRQVVITLDIDDTREGVSGSKGVGHRADHPQRFHVEVMRDGMKPDAPLMGIAAHELGHVLARVFETPKAMDDLNNRGNSNLTAIFGNTGPQKARLLAAEREAWELAHQMVGRENCPTEDVDLKTYEESDGF